MEYEQHKWRGKKADAKERHITTRNVEWSKAYTQTESERPTRKHGNQRQYRYGILWVKVNAHTELAHSTYTHGNGNSNGIYSCLAPAADRERAKERERDSRRSDVGFVDLLHHYFATKSIF